MNSFLRPLWAMILIFLILGLALTTSCTNEDKTAILREERATKADKKGKDRILIGIVDSDGSRSPFLEGARLALETINQRGGILGRQVSALFFDDFGDTAKGQKIARTLADNPEVVAVVGHGYSDVAISVSITYEKAGILFLSYGAMDPIFSQSTGHLTFSNIITEKEIGAGISDFFTAIDEPVIKLAVLMESSDYGSYERIVDSFLSYTENPENKTQVKLTALRSYFGNRLHKLTRRSFNVRTDFYDILWNLKTFNTFSAILIAGDLNNTASLIEQARMLEINVPILAIGAKVTPMNLKTACKVNLDKIIVPTHVDPQSQSNQDFSKTFKKRFGVPPGMWGTQGYDAVMVLADAMVQAETTVPSEVATMMRFFLNFKGKGGNYSFTKDGRPQGKKLYFIRASDHSPVTMKALLGKENIGRDLTEDNMSNADLSGEKVQNAEEYY